MPVPHSFVVSHSAQGAIEQVSIRVQVFSAQLAIHRVSAFEAE
jgi:hypothetical protein